MKTTTFAAASKLTVPTLVAALSASACIERADTLVAPEPEVCPDEPLDRPLRLATYNIKAARDSSLEDIAAVLKDLDADVIALQEVDRLVERSGSVDQAGELAAALEMRYVYSASRVRESGDYGVALLSRLPIANAARAMLPSFGSFEPRSAVIADVCAGGGETVRVIGTHIDLNPFVAGQQHSALSELAAPFVGEGVVVMGDFNATDADPGLAALFDTPLADLGSLDDVPTCAGRRIDFVLADDPLAARALDASVVTSDASDHFPVVVELGT